MGKTILFVGEAVTLAHVARPAVLATAMADAGYDVHFASSGVYAAPLAQLAARHWTIPSLAPQTFIDRLANGDLLYTHGELEAYVRDELALFERVRPAAVIGDFRISLAVSARIADIPFVNVVNAHWSPYRATGRMPMPEHALTRRIGVPLSNAAFGLAWRAVFRHGAGPINRVRKTYGMSPVQDIRYAYTDGELTLYPDTPSIAPTDHLPRTHIYIGPIFWCPRVDLPTWWDSLPAHRPLVYVSLGSSGRSDLLPRIIEALRGLGVVIVVSTAGRASIPTPGETTFSADLLPGDIMVRRAAFAVINGGSASAYQALAAGCPILGIPSNLDQHLSMAEIERIGAGISVRSEHATAKRLTLAASQILADGRHADQARRIAREWALWDGPRQFVESAARLVADV